LLVRPKKVGDVVDSNRELPPVFDSEVGTGGGSTFDRGGEYAPVHEAPRLMVIRADLEGSYDSRGV
jgi:hypothetical protein